ncbi:MAG: class I SAM-dependent methyltransferase [Actinobacteria bacterium]|nr:class I SAM-dependent methyltransferase [Actinomycetota bacterium]
MSEASDPVFARIASRYDLINRILSLGRERKWRRRGVQMLPQGTVLDLGCGTGNTDFGTRRVVGLDPVVEMIALSPLPDRVVGVGETLPFRDDAFDGVFTGYVMRNLTSVNKTLEEAHRVLRPGGVVVVIDLGRPAKPVLRVLHRIGTALILPLVGLALARSPGEYWYLHRSLDSLPPPEELYRGHRLGLEEVWRMGMFGFVYGARLRKR